MNMKLFENIVKLRGFLGSDADVPQADTVTRNSVALLKLGIPTGIWRVETNEWLPRIEWHRVVCPGPYFCGYAKILKKGDFIEVEGELHFSEDDLPVMIEGERFNWKRSCYEVQALEIRKIDHPPIGVEESDGS